MRTRIFRRFLWSALVLFLMTLLVVDFNVTRYVRAKEQENFRRHLQDEERILAAEAVVDWRNWVETAARRADARVSVLGANGVVVADSDPDSGLAQDSVEQIVAAGPMGGNTLRLSAPLNGLSATIADLRWRLLYITLLATLLWLGMAYIFMRSFSHRIARLRAYVEGLPHAKLERELPDADDELGALAASLRRTAPQIRDLVDRLKLESARREAILGSMVEGVLAVDKELRVIFCNDSFAHAAGAATPVSEGIPLVQLVRDPGLLDILGTVLYTGKRVSRPLRLRAARAHTFEVQAAPLEGTTARGVLAVLHDVTELERLERIRKDFVANVSHELRTPLASIRGYAETLLDGALEDHEHNRKFVEIILAQAIRLNNIATDLLTLSELESTGDRFQPQRISVRNCVKASVRMVEATARVRNVALVTGNIDDVEVMGHEIRLEQALINLLDNAVKFNRPGGEVRIETAGSENGTVTITISDTGVGIPSDDLPRIFERFYRVDKARSRAVGGTGLGLSIVKHVIEQMGGEIQVRSQMGKGTTFTIRVSRAE